MQAEPCVIAVEEHRGGSGGGATAAESLGPSRHLFGNGTCCGRREGSRHLKPCPSDIPFSLKKTRFDESDLTTENAFSACGMSQIGRNWGDLVTPHTPPLLLKTPPLLGMQGRAVKGDEQRVALELAQLKRQVRFPSPGFYSRLSRTRGVIATTPLCSSSTGCQWRYTPLGMKREQRRCLYGGGGGSCERTTPLTALQIESAVG